MTNVTEPAIRRVIQPIVRCVGESRDKEYGMKIIDAKFRPTGAIDSRPTGGTLEGRLTSPSAPARLSTGRGRGCSERRLTACSIQSERRSPGCGGDDGAAS